MDLGRLCQTRARARVSRDRIRSRVGRGGDFAKNWWGFCEAITCAFCVHLLCIHAALFAHFCLPRRMHRMQRAGLSRYG